MNPNMNSSRWRFLLALFLGTLLFTTLAVKAHDGHDHDHEDDAEDDEPVFSSPPIEAKPKASVQFKVRFPSLSQSVPSLEEANISSTFELLLSLFKLGIS